MVGRWSTRPAGLRPKAKKARRVAATHAHALTAVSFSNLKTPSRQGPSKLNRMRDLHYAASIGQTQWLQITLQKAESPNLADINGFSTLHTAALHGRLDCMKMLIEKYNMDVNLGSLRGWRPIHLVLGQDSKNMAMECLTYLLSKGANVNVRLSHAMWKADKKHQLEQMCKLESVKMECEMQQRHFLQREQREVNICNMMAFENWLQQKGLPTPSWTILSLAHIQRHSVILRKLVGRIASPIPSLSTLLRGEQSDSVLSMRWRYRRQKPWNFSPNLASAPATCISRPNVIRLGVEPDKLPQQDFTSFIFLFKNTFGEPVIQIDNIGRVTPVPDLPYEVLHRNLFPGAWVSRLNVPKDLRQVQIFNLKHRRPPEPEHWWNDQMALSMRATLDPVFLSGLQSHLATYCSVEVMGPRTEGSESSKETPSVPSEVGSP